MCNDICEKLFAPHYKHCLCVQCYIGFWGQRWIRLICCLHVSQRPVRCNLLLFMANQPCLISEPTTIIPQTTLSKLTSHSFPALPLCPIPVVSFTALMSSSLLPYSPSSCFPTWNFISAPYFSEVCVFMDKISSCLGDSECLIWKPQCILRFPFLWYLTALTLNITLFFSDCLVCFVSLTGL